MWVQLQFVITVHNRCLQVHTWAWWRSWTTCKHWASMLLSCCLSRSSTSSNIIRCSPGSPTFLTPAQNTTHIRSQYDLQQTDIPRIFLCTMACLDSCPACINRCATQLTASSKVTAMLRRMIWNPRMAAATLCKTSLMCIVYAADPWNRQQLPLQLLGILHCWLLCTYVKVQPGCCRG